MKSTFHAYLVLTLFLFSACSSEEEVLTTLDFASQIRVIDLENDESASDLIVLFKLDDPTVMNSLKLFIIESIRYNDITLQDLQNLDDSRTQSVSLTDNGSSFEVSLLSSLQEFNGNPIQNGKSYNVGFIAEVDGNIRLNSQSGLISLSEEHFLNGDYTGTWNDNLYTDFGISAKLKVSGSTISGPFFYSPNFVSCCSGINDGSISFRLVDGAVQNFKYAQSLASFMGGECPGVYNGEGVQENYTSFVIPFDGNDCEGDHVGEIILTKI